MWNVPAIFGLYVLDEGEAKPARNIDRHPDLLIQPIMISLSIECYI